MKKVSPQNPCPSSETDNIIQRILKLLGDVVLIPIYPLSKKPVGRGWQLRTLESMKDSLYLRSFDGKNIGVLLGKASGGLCTIDIDADADIEPFLASNPRLRDTTRTKRVRGCNIWIYVDGEFPASTTLIFGEWRADGNQTVIYGQAIDKKKGETEPTAYKFLKEVPPIRIRFNEIKFPNGCFEKPKPHPPPVRLNTASCIPASLHNKADSVLANIKAKREALDALATKHPNLVSLYNEFIEPRFQAQAHSRNAFIVQAVPFLYRAVAPEYVLELVGCFYDCNRALFNDPREQHLKEAQAMLESVAITYAKNLNVCEREIYDALPGHEQDAFRICRDLAALENPKNKRGEFFMSFNQLGDRLGIFPMQAQRVMRQLESYGLISLLKKGTKRAVGVRGEAGEYQWNLTPADS